MHELLARISATAGASGPASGSLNGGLDQAESDPETDPQSALRSPPSRNGHNGSGSVNSASDLRRNDAPQASRSRVPPRSMQNQPQDARGCRKVPPNALGPRRETGDRGHSGSPNSPTEPNGNQQQNGDYGKPDHESDIPSRAMLTLQPGQDQNHDCCHPGKSDVLPLLPLSIRVQRRSTSGHPEESIRNVDAVLPIRRTGLTRRNPVSSVACDHAGG